MLSTNPTPAPSGVTRHRPRRKRIELAVTLAGRRALSFLEEPAPGRVLHVFDNCIYLENSRGELACLGGPEIGAAPLNAVAIEGRFPAGGFLGGGFPGWRSQLSAGDWVSGHGGRILLGRSLALCCHETRPWHPESPALPIRPRLLAVHLEALRAAFSTSGPLDGLGILVTNRDSRSTHPPRGLGQLLAFRAGMALEALEGWLRRSLPMVGGFAEDRLAPPPPGEAAALIGLGPGLTPSGDDLIGGMSIALHAIARPGLADVLGRWALSLARGRSTRISMAHLSAACDGEGAAALHGVLSGLGRDPDWTPEAVLTDPFFSGHTSGWDALAGILAVMSNLPAANDPSHAA